MKTLNSLLLSALLFLGSSLAAISFHTDGTAHAGLRGNADFGGGNRGAGAGRAALGGSRASRIDRQPRASSARRGSIRPEAARSPASTKGKGGDARTKGTAAATGKRPAGLSSISDIKAKQAKNRTGSGANTGQVRDRKDIARNMDSAPNARMADTRTSAGSDRKSPRDDLRNKKVSQQQRDLQQRDLQKGRTDYQNRRKDIERDRGDTLVELQENRLEFKEERREDRMDFAEDRREDRMDFREDMLRERRYLYDDLYYHHHYWGYDDDDDNWFWLLFGGFTGYMIGASINDQPEGSVPVTTGNTTYQYYGGTFYQPAEDGQGYTTVPAPVNAQVEAPPIDCTIVFTPPPDDIGYCYFQGAFFLYDDETDNYVVTIPQTGTEVPYLPEGYEIQSANGVEYFVLGAVTYRPVMSGDGESFVVAELSSIE